MKDLTKAKELLESGEYTCVLCGSSVYTSKLRGVKPLVAWYASQTPCRGFCAADKVVGRGAAFMYVLMGVKAVYARLISDAALSLLLEQGISVEYSRRVPNIINRSGDGICPFEAAVLNITEPKKAYTAIRAKMNELNITIEE